jgi:hypothetical protein
MFKSFGNLETKSLDDKLPHTNLSDGYIYDNDWFEKITK